MWTFPLEGLLALKAWKFNWFMQFPTKLSKFPLYRRRTPNSTYTPKQDQQLHFPHSHLISFHHINCCCCCCYCVIVDVFIFNFMFPFWGILKLLPPPTYSSSKVCMIYNTLHVVYSGDNPTLTIWQKYQRPTHYKHMPNKPGAFTLIDSTLHGGAWNSGICCRIIMTWQSKHNDGNWFQRPGGEKHEFNVEQLQTHKCSFNLWGPNFSWEGNWFLFRFERLFLNNLCVCAGEGRLVGLSQ